MRLTLITYGLLAGAAPALVLANSVLMSEGARQAQPLQTMALAAKLMDSEPKTLTSAYQSIPKAQHPSSQAQIVNEDGQFFIEFYHSLNAVAQMPSLMLSLDTQAEPDDHFVYESDRYLTIGELDKNAGQHRYLLPTAAAKKQYFSVIIWCPELDTVLGYIPILHAA